MFKRTKNLKKVGTSSSMRTGSFGKGRKPKQKVQSKLVARPKQKDQTKLVGTPKQFMTQSPARPGQKNQLYLVPRPTQFKTQDITARLRRATS